MKKPIVFFSHSSQDKETLAKLKDMFCQKTGGSVEVFLSSDGQSIPLGRNWVHRIQEALEQAAILVVFITPNSLRSNWINFESGFCYAKDIRVVPVGFLGIDLSIISPPLSLLQGFNINSEDGLDNLIALMNDEFKHNHLTKFTNEEYQEIVSSSNFIESHPLGKYGSFIDEVKVSVSDKDGFLCPAEIVIEQVKEIMGKREVEYSEGEKHIRTFGMSLHVESAGVPKVINIVLDPLMLNITFPLIKETIRNIKKNGVKDVSFSFSFIEPIKCITHNHKITSRLFGTGLKLGKKDGLVYKDLLFSIAHSFYANGRGNYKQGPPYMKVTPENDEIEIISINGLLSILFDRKVLYIGSEEYSTRE